MYTEVNFGKMLATVLSRVRFELNIEVQIPSPAMAHTYQTGTWCYDIDNRFDVKVWRWGTNREEIVAGPYCNNVKGTEEFEARFEKDLRATIVMPSLS